MKLHLIRSCHSCFGTQTDVSWFFTMSQQVVPGKIVHLKDIKNVSGTFCILPWIHIHTIPAGKAAPCCISNSCTTDDGVGSSLTSNLKELVNSEKMKKLRLDMLAGVRNKECKICYQHEDAGISSFRNASIKDFGQYYEEVIEQTNDDGSLKEFRMRYFDMRVSNICNFKCRTCDQNYSSQWEQENKRHKHPTIHFSPLPKNKNKQLIYDVIEQIDYMDAAYFAGGEPLITEEHYILLEEMIRRNRTDIKLRYNTNLSNLKYKDKDILNLWKNFKNKIDIYASIDHFGKRAEYIRHGTEWNVIESNFKLVQNQKFIHLQINTVLSLFNLLTIDEFYKYLITNRLYSCNSRVFMLYPMSSPEYLSTHALPKEYKYKGKQSLERTKQLLIDNNFKNAHIDQINSAINWIDASSIWEEQKAEFRRETIRVDKIRNENFSKVFPELANLLEENND